MVGLVRSLGKDAAVIVGHDWGVWIAAHAALLRPDLFRAVALLSVPYVPRRPVNQTQWEQQRYPGKIFYQAMFRSPAAEAYFKTDIRGVLLTALYSLSGDAAVNERWNPVADPTAPPAAPHASAECPAWITGSDLDLLEAEYKRAGFTGGLNCYRNMDRSWAMTPFLDGAKILQPALFIAGDRDPVIEFLGEELDVLEKNMPNLKKQVLLEGAGHWTQQERPQEVNRLLIEFLKGL